MDLSRLERRRITEAVPTAQIPRDLSARTAIIQLESGFVSPAKGRRGPLERGRSLLICVAGVHLDRVSQGTQQRGFRHAD